MEATNYTRLNDLYEKVNLTADEPTRQLIRLLAEELHRAKGELKTVLVVNGASTDRIKEVQADREAADDFRFRVNGIL